MTARNRFTLTPYILSALTLLTTHLGQCFAADQVVTNCANDNDLRTKLAAMQSSGGGTLTFDCGTPSSIIILSGTPLPSITANSVVDGGNKITISGNNAW